MVDKWSLFKQFWGAEDEEKSPITDASAANDYLVENAIIEFQEKSKELTQMTVALSASRVEIDEILQKLREAVTIAYSYSLDDKFSEVKSILEKVLNV